MRVTWARGSALARGAAAALRAARWAACQRAMRVRSTMAAKASAVNANTDRWPKGTTMNAAISGPSDWPKLPPTWNTICAKP